MIISITGRIGSGKDTLAAHLIESHDFVKFSFAGKLKDAVSIIFGWDRELLDGATVDSRTWREQVDPWWSTRLNIPNLTPRWVLQNFGTQACRNHFHNDIWLAALEKTLLDMTDRNIVVTDTRFTNEIAAMKNAGAKIFCIKRGPDPEWFTTANTPAGRKTLSLCNDIPPSEYDWAGETFDMTFYNNSTRVALYYDLDKVLESYK